MRGSPSRTRPSKYRHFPLRSQYGEGGDDSYYDDGSGVGGGAATYAYDEYAGDYEAGVDGGDYELTPQGGSSSTSGGRGIGSWFSRRKGQQEPAAIEW